MGKMMLYINELIAFLCIVLLMSSCSVNKNKDVQYAGSESCMECHEDFYKLWLPSYHGQAMMPVNAEFIKKHKLPDSPAVQVEGHLFVVEVGDSIITMYEKENDSLIATYNIEWAMGGHNVYCFLTPFEKGKLQTAPLAYDVNAKTWFNYPQSSVRDYNDSELGDAALSWKDPMFAFNTGCYSCHVSQLSSNYDLATDTYQAKWREAGINCETCHGPGEEHIKACRGLKEGEEPKDMKLVVTTDFTAHQQNDACLVCHAKMYPITPSYMPGEEFFDNYNVTTLEDRDFYPDGRDLGENYTMTGWMMNPCAQESDLNCITCHTSSGRDRNKDNPNQSCASCHNDKVANFEAHSGHPLGAGPTCVSCHMPKRQFVGRFLRSDHSFRPPMPEATIKFGSPNACNQCHTDKTPQWANEVIRERTHNSTYQEETLKWAELIQEARQMNWENVDDMFNYIRSHDTNEVVVNSLIRLLYNYAGQEKITLFIEALNNNSALVRSSAAAGLRGTLNSDVKDALLRACQDSVRLVRIQAVSSILSFPSARFSEAEQGIINSAEQEYVTSMRSRQDDWSEHYNLGLYYQQKGDLNAALNAYETASRLYPASVMPFINSSVLYSMAGNQDKAKEVLLKALKYSPGNEAVNLNLGLLYAEQGENEKAERALKVAFDANPKEQSVAAKNLSVLAGQRGDFESAVEYARTAWSIQKDNPDYGYYLAYYLFQNNQSSEAVDVLKTLLRNNPEYMTAREFLASIYLNSNQKGKALQLYRDALNLTSLSEQDKIYCRQVVEKLQPNN
jgi:Flp pilus assembly protein TadD